MHKKAATGVIGLVTSVMCLNNSVFAYAAGNIQTVTEMGTRTATVSYTKDSTYSVTIPKNIVLDTNSQSSEYSISVSGDILGDAFINVSPDSIVTLKDSHGKNDVEANVTQAKVEFLSDDVAANATTKGNISASGLSAGDWSGSLNFNIDFISGNLIIDNFGGVELSSTDTPPAVGDVVVPSIVTVDSSKKYKLVGLGSSTFYGASNLTSMELPDSITSLGSYLFNSCSKLKYVKLPSSITTIEDHMFSNCTSLSSVGVPEGLESIKDYAFNQCTSLQEIEIPNVTSIGELAFSQCSNLKTVNLQKIRKIGDIAFSECKKLESIDLSQVQEIGGSAFEHCSALKSVDLSSATSIGWGTFRGCSNLSSVKLSDNLQVIESGLFNSTAISSITLPSKLTELGDFAFERCKNLSSVSYKGVAYTKWSELKPVLLSNGVSIGTVPFEETPFGDIE